MHYTLAALILATTVRLFHDETVTSLAVSRHTHVRVTGRVVLVKKEADGDIHFRIADDAGHFIVCEIVPYHPLQAPKLGQMVTVEGISRYDKEAGHLWFEIHPVENWYPAHEKGGWVPRPSGAYPSPIEALRQSITTFRFQDSLATSAVNPHTRSYLGVMTKGIGAAFLMHISDVVDLCAEEEMGWVYAVAVVAAVEHEESVWDGAVSKFPRNM